MMQLSGSPFPGNGLGHRRGYAELGTVGTVGAAGAALLTWDPFRLWGDPYLFAVQET